MAKETPTGHFRLLYFGTAASFTKKSFDDVPAPLGLSNLFAMLEEKYQGITERVLLSCAVTVNLDYVDMQQDSRNPGSDIEVQAGDEVAIIPPVSSG